MRIKKVAIIAFAFSTLGCGSLLSCFCLGLTRANATADPAIICSTILNGLKFCSSTPHIEVDSNGEITIKTSLQNTTQSALPIDRTSYINARFGIKIMDENNHEIIPFLEKKMADGTITDEEVRIIVRQRSLSHQILDLNAGATLDERIKISDYYHLTQSGHYFIEISRKNRKPDGEDPYAITLPERIEVVVH